VVYESEHSEAADLPAEVLEPEPVVDVAVAPESEWVPEAVAEDGQERESEAVAEPQPHPEPHPEPQPEPQPATLTEEQPDNDEPEKLKGATLKRLLWGAGNRGD
jgi:hypothetical protein